MRNGSREHVMFRPVWIPVLLTGLVSAVILFSAGCLAGGLDGKTLEYAESEPELSEKDVMAAIKIKGMSCNHCVMAVTKALNEIDGVKDVKVDLSRGEATFDEAKPIDMNLIKDKIKKAGYEVV